MHISGSTSSRTSRPRAAVITSRIRRRFPSQSPTVWFSDAAATWAVSGICGMTSPGATPNTTPPGGLDSGQGGDVAHRGPRPALAAGLSLLVPGIGQLYAGHPWWGLLWLVVTPGFWIGTGGCLGWLCHVVAALHAWDLAARSR